MRHEDGGEREGGEGCCKGGYGDGGDPLENRPEAPPADHGDEQQPSDRELGRRKLPRAGRGEELAHDLEVHPDAAVVDAGVRVVDVVEDGVEIRVQLAANRHHGGGRQERDARAAHGLQRTPMGRWPVRQASK